MDSGITSIIFNGKPTKAGPFKDVVKALSDETILAEKGGYLFSLHIDDHTLHIGILPYFIGNERSHHYDIEIPASPYNLIGFVNADTTVELFFKLDREDYVNGLDDDARARYRENYVRFFRFMMESGYPPGTELQVATLDLLKEFNIIPDPPETVGELAALPLH